MSYDLYCYRPVSDSPDVNEARRLVESFNAEEEEMVQRPETIAGMKEQIAAALLQHNPRLQRFVLDYANIARSQNISEDEARDRYQHIELNSPEGEPAAQFDIHSDYVFVNTPYRYEGRKADDLFTVLSGYLRVIRDVAGYFVYDPQKDTAFDPAQTDLRDHSEYDHVIKQMPQMIAQLKAKARKPWWKFW